MLAGVIIILTLKGPGHKPSVIGIERCDPGDHGLLASLIILAVVMEVVAIVIAKLDYDVKQEVDWQFIDSCYKHDYGQLWKYPTVSFFGTLIAILIGSTPAFFYVPFLMSCKLPMDVVI
jgi:hypothetical protein